MQALPIIKIKLIVLGLFFFTACGERQEIVVQHAPDAIHSEDSCHVCGMTVPLSGPKAQAFVRNREQPFKFCSTQDLFSWLLQPETAAIVQEIYVHDMGATDWEEPADGAFVDATTAWYVSGHDQRGAMGPTLASFTERKAAEDFAAQYGGRVLAYKEIDLNVLIDTATPP